MHPLTDLLKVIYDTGTSKSLGLSVMINCNGLNSIHDIASYLDIPTNSLNGTGVSMAVRNGWINNTGKLKPTGLRGNSSSSVYELTRKGIRLYTKLMETYERPTK